MRKIVFFSIGILLLVLIGWGVFKITRNHRNVAGETAVATISSEDLYRDFATAETQANKKWTGQVIEITGTINSTSEAGNYVSVNLAAGPEGGVNCSILKNELKGDENLKKGASIVIKGKCTGFLMDVNMVDCVIKK